MNTVQLTAVFSENKQGQLARVTKALSEAGVNIHWLGIAGTDSYGVIRLLADRQDAALQTLQRCGFTVSPVDVLAVEAEDRPGSLHEAIRVLSEAGAGIRSCSGFVFNNRAVFLIEPDGGVEQAGALLSAKGLRLLSQKEMIGL